MNTAKIRQHTMLYRYQIKYTNRKGKEVTAYRYASCAGAAFEMYAHQYHYGTKLTLIDAETRGLKACEGYFCESYNGGNPFSFVEVVSKGYEVC